jgi:hypothetical protein
MMVMIAIENCQFLSSIRIFNQEQCSSVRIKTTHCILKDISKSTILPLLKSSCQINKLFSAAAEERLVEWIYLKRIVAVKRDDDSSPKGQFILNKAVNFQFNNQVVPLSLSVRYCTRAGGLIQ